MSGIKVTVTVEPAGDKKATLKLTHTESEEGAEPDVREVTVGKTPVAVESVFELQANGKVEIEVTEVVELVYDPAQMTVTEKERPVEPMKAEAKEASARSAPKSAKEESGASSANHETAKPRSTHK